MQKAEKYRIRKDDQVMVVAGKERGKTGRVSKVNVERATVLVEKLNIVKRHTKPAPNRKQSGIVEKEAPLSISNVMLICGKCGKPVRTGMKTLEDKSKVRFCKKCGEVIDK
jgi:large subunit ribosomal protein L24